MVRAQTAQLVENLSAEDFNLQSMPEASPLKWHLAHTTWFFETFVLQAYLKEYEPFSPHFGMLFNSYYESVGPRWPRSQRGLLSRPTIGEVFKYRSYVDGAIQQFVRQSSEEVWSQALPILELGLHHEQQHQELMLTDLKHAWALNPLGPCYREGVTWPERQALAAESEWVEFTGGLMEMGHEGPGFAFDNEGPRHKVWLGPYRLARDLVTCGSFAAFIADGGYEQPQWWLSEGWETVRREGWAAPLYWRRGGEGWEHFTLTGWRPILETAPVCHVSFFEADAYARWSGARLPTEHEWEAAAADQAIQGRFLESEWFHPQPGPVANDGGPVRQMFGDVWQWTASSYVGYPGFHPVAGALGEYNGKFTCNQWVLRGASCVTPRTHARTTYRNFFPASARWQFTGLRLAQDVAPCVRS